MDQSSPNDIRNDSPYVQLEDIQREENDISMMSEEAAGSDGDEGDERDERDGAGEGEDEQSDDEAEEVLHETHDDEKRSLRPSNHEKRGSFGEHGDDSDPEVDSDAEDFHQPCLANALTALKHYFFNRLEQTVAFLGGSPDHLKGWKIQVVKRTGGLTLGLIEIFYFSHRGKKFRSRVEVACFLNLMPSIKNIRSMSRDQFYLNAIESRERHLISQQLALCNFSCEEIVFQNDVIKLVSSGVETSLPIGSGSASSSQEEPHATSTEEKPAFIDFRTAKDLYFSFGNMIILDWGKLLPDPAFHTNNQLFPLGFRCLRQEHDVTLDRVVDCLCEIDAVFEGGDGASVLQMLRKGSFQNNQVDTRRPLLPLFRLSVAWHIGDEKNIGTSTEQDSVQVRVYEARSPQQAWQSAMLEGLGIKDEKLVRPGSASAAEDPALEGDQDHADPTSLEDQDEEELALRMKIREQRRAYFRVLRAEQSAGMQAAVRPRLSLETVDSFAEDLVMRLFEGMEGSINCRSYQYMDSREREAGKKNMLKGYSKAFTKAKNLDRVIRKNVYLAEQIQQLEQKRRRVEDLESRKRAKTEDKEMRSLLIIAQKSRTVKMREMEKNITLLKVAMAKTVKKRRDDAKLLAEILCDKEEILRFSKANGLSTSPCALKVMEKMESEMDTDGGDHTASSESRPESLENAVAMDGCVVGQLVEVWEFLNTFSKDVHVSPEDIPSVETLLQAVKVCDPAYRGVKDYTRGLERSFDRAVQYQGADLTDSQANHILNKLGVVFCSSLLREFDRIMGIDLAEMQLGGLRIPLNELTWREVARIVLLGSCCREVGVGDVDASALLKGRGFFTTPESADRKVLKLARRRIKFAYVIRSELQESVYGFSSGLCVRLPAPANPYIEGTVFWTELVASLRQVPDSYGWLIYEIIKAAALAVCIIDTTAAAKKLKRSLLRTLSLPSFRMDHGAETKAAALQILAAEEQLSLQLRLTNGRWRKTVPVNSITSASESANDAMEVASSTESNTSAVDTVKTLCDTLRLVYDQSPYMVPPSTFDLWAKQLREAARHADLRKSSAPTFTAASLEESDRQDAERDLTNAMDEDNELENGAEVVVKAEAKAVVPETEVIDDDTKQAEKLSIAMQRCYLVIRDLMSHPQTNPFNWPVDFGALPGYYKSIAQPLSLSEVRKYLVEGHYSDSIFNFYTDVLLVIENAMAYNQENSAVKLSAQKVLTIFERLFFETVLCWDSPLPFHDSCHACRSPHPISVSKAAVCDRCEGTYHLHCLDPPMHTPPRSEWYCLPCVEQKGVPTAHPYKTADVLHPTDPEARGEVVGMEQIRQTAMFVVEFGSVRELWDGKKVRQYAVEPQNEEIVLPKGTFVLKEDPDSVKSSLGFSGSSSSSSSDGGAVGSSADGSQAAVSVYTMPSGYSYEDFDRVCGIARAYTGWGASHYLVPPVIMDEHSLLAQNRAKHDTMFPQFRDSVAALGPAAGGVLGDALSSKEWGTVLSALLHRVMDIAPLGTTLGQMDDAVDDDLIAQIQDGVHTNSLPLEKVFAFVRGEGLIKTVKVIDPDAPVEPVRRGRKKRVVEGAATAAAPVKQAAAVSASSAAGDDEDGAEEDEDGEDEWDEDMDEVAPSKKAEEKKPAKKAGGSATKAKKVIQDDDEDEMDFAAEASFNANYNRAQSAAGSNSNGAADETDSADEDDLEFFDEHGNCLTSGTVAAPAMSPPQRVPTSASSEYVMGGDVDPLNGAGDSPSAPSAEEAAKSLEPETEDEWNLRHLSRQKGREDALLTQTLVLDTLTTLDVDGSKEKEEEVFKLINQDDIGGDFYSAAVNAIIKSCLGRPSESLVALEWTRGWEAKMEAMQHYLHDYTFQGKEMLCPICGFEEGYLSSPFVWGQTTEEWEADVAADTAQDVLTEPEPPNDVNAFPLAAGVSASTGIKGFRARYRVMKGLVWRPYNETEAHVEEGECALAKRTLKAGTQVMHECCANFMHFNRQMKQDKSRKMEDQRIVEVISGIGRAKCTPIGIDREGSFYWILRGCKALFVSTGGIETLREKSAHKCAPNAGRWSMYRNEAEISEVLNWLDPKVTNERILRKTLSILFPNAATEGDEGDAKPAAAAAVIGNATTTEATPSPETKVGPTAELAADLTAMQVEEPNTVAVPVPVISQPIKLNRMMSVDLMEQSADEGGESSDEDDLQEKGSSSNGALAIEAQADGEVQEEDEADDLEEELNSHRRNARRVAGSSGSGEAATGASNNDEPVDVPLTAKELVLRDQRRATALDALNNRPALTHRSALLDLYSPEPEFTGKKASVFKFRKGEHVLVDASTRNHILWDARVLETKTHRVVCAGDDGAGEFSEQLLYCKVRFDRWGSAYDGWYEECQLLSANAVVSAVGRPKTTARALAQESKVDFIRQNVWTPPELLQSLFAYNFINEPNRASGGRPRLTYSDCESAVGLLRSAMLMIEAALPTGCVDDSDDRWAEDFAVPWREAVAVASDAISLMQCQLMLEYGIRTSWLRPTGLKMFSCLPSRVQCARNATVGLVAIRVWVLDSTIKYDQIKKRRQACRQRQGPPAQVSIYRRCAQQECGGLECEQEGQEVK